MYIIFDRFFYKIIIIFYVNNGIWLVFIFFYLDYILLYSYLFVCLL